MRRPWAVVLVVGLVLAVGLAVAVAVDGDGEPGADSEPACARVDDAAEQDLMNEYAAGAFTAHQEEGDDGAPTRVWVDLPPIRFTGEGSSPTLPIGPCQHIYRFAFPDVHATGGRDPAPFRYVEIDWNTEGRPRGPNGSFISPHFDFHFYLRPADEVNATTGCVVSANGVTCDPLRTDYTQMLRFLDVPTARFVPPRYGPDVDSSIPEMGLHLLDATSDYTVESVNHEPVLIYGTFAGKVFFAEASVTLFTLQDAVDAPDNVVSFPFRQPRAAEGGQAWPTRFVIRYRPGSRTFQAGFEGFRFLGD